MRSLLEGGGLESEGEHLLLLGSREGKRDRNPPGCFPQDFALVPVYVLSAWHLDQSSGGEARLPGREAVRQAACGRRARVGSLARWKVVALLGMAGARRRLVLGPRCPSACQRPFLSPRPRAGRIGSGQEHASASRATWPLLLALTLAQALPWFTTGFRPWPLPPCSPGCNPTSLSPSSCLTASALAHGWAWESPPSRS